MSSLLRFDPRRHLLVKLGVFQNLATHYDRSESGLRRKTVPLHRSEMSNQMSVDIKKERNHLLSLPLHDGLQTVHRTVLRLSKNRDSLTNSWLTQCVFPGLHSKIQTTFRNGFLSKIPHGKLHEGLHISIQIINFMIHFISLHPSIL